MVFFQIKLYKYYKQNFNQSVVNEIKKVILVNLSLSNWERFETLLLFLAITGELFALSELLLFNSLLFPSAAIVLSRSS